MTEVAVTRVASPAAMEDLGRGLAGVLGAGDLVVLAGDLGSGKTTLVRGIGAGLRVRGPVTSPTFVVSRIHPSLIGGPSLVHVDAYRLRTTAEIDDLDLDSPDDVTVVEWGAGRVEHLSDARLEVTIEMGEAPDERVLSVRGVGSRWDGVDLPAIVACTDPT